MVASILKFDYGRSMKFWSVMVLVFALCFGGFAANSHAEVSDSHQYGVHGVSHDQHEKSSSSDKSNADSLCEMVCHAPVTLGALPFHHAVSPFVESVATTTYIELASLAVPAPFQPPQLS